MHTHKTLNYNNTCTHIKYESGHALKSKDRTTHALCIYTKLYESGHALKSKDRTTHALCILNKAKLNKTLLEVLYNGILTCETLFT